MYEETEAPCLAFKNMMESITTQENDFYGSGWKQGLPWLYYVDNGQQVIERDSNVVEGKLSFDSSDTNTLTTLRFVMGKYSLDGYFLGYENLTTQLQLCPADYTYGVDYRRFGTTVYSSCSYDLSQLITEYLQPNNTNIFYDLWLVDYDGDFIDVPVKIKNYVDNNGNKPNESDDPKDWKLTRRFFIYDTKSGLEGTDAYTSATSYGSYIRWLASIKFVVELDTSKSDSIYIPYVELEYNSKAKTFIPDSTQAEVSFAAEYRMDPTDFWTVAWIFFGIANGLVIVITIFKVVVWARKHPSELMGSVYSFYLAYRIGFSFCEVWSAMMFWFLFAVAASWYFFFKLETAPYLLLPIDEGTNHLPFAIIFGLVTALKIILISIKVFQQARTKFYVLDREKNMNRVLDIIRGNIPRATSYEDSDKDIIDKYSFEKEEPKAWRSVFVMNELNELCMTKVIHVEVVLVWTAFLMYGQGWQYAAEYDPQVETIDSRSPKSYVLMYFLFTLVIMTTGVTVYLIRYLFAFFFPLAYMEFVDLCAVANVSLFIFDEKFHGYYIHGASPSNTSDVTLDALKMSLDQEGVNQGTNRGLVANNNLQCYEFFIPYVEKKNFDEVFEENEENLAKKKGDEEAYKKKTPHADFLFKTNTPGLYEEDFRKVSCLFFLYSF